MSVYFSVCMKHIPVKLFNMAPSDKRMKLAAYVIRTCVIDDRGVSGPSKESVQDTAT